jgi:hypothetical protein
VPRLLSDASRGGTLGPTVTANAAPPASRSIDRVPLRRPDGSPIVGRATIRAATALAEAVFARGGEPPSRDRIAWLERELEDFLARSGRRSRLLLSFLVRFVAFLAPLFIGRIATLRSLSIADRVRALSRLERKFGEPLLAVKAMLCLLYYEHPDAAREVGFDGRGLVPRPDRGQLEVLP